MNKWRSVPFYDAVEDCTAGTARVPRSEYLARGELAVVDQGQEPIGGYVDASGYAYKGRLPVIIFGDHTRIFKYVDFPFVPGGEGVRILRALPGFEPRFLYHYFQSRDIPSRGYSRHFKLLKELEIPRPAIAEQRRIAEVLDRAGELLAKRRRAIVLLGDLARSMFLDMFGDPVTNRRGWPWLPLTQACRLYSGGTPAKSNSENWTGGLPWFSAKDLKQSDLWDSQDHINERIPETTSLRLLAADTVVIVVRGMILRHTFPVSVLRVPATVNQDLKALLPRAGLAPQFLAFCLRVQAGHVLRQVSTAAHGTARLDADGLGRIPILLPPRRLQDEFVARLAEHERLGTAQKTAQAELENLFGSLQARAFRGEL